MAKAKTKTIKLPSGKTVTLQPSDAEERDGVFRVTRHRDGAGWAVFGERGAFLGYVDARAPVSAHAPSGLGDMAVKKLGRTLSSVEAACEYLRNY